MGARSIDVEIYDECTFSPDALIAHTSVPITESLLTKGEMVDDWWPLSGQEGEEKEGLLHLILSLQVIWQSILRKKPFFASKSMLKPQFFTTFLGNRFPLS